MSAGMARLKELSLGLGDEIHAQNEQLDRVKGKVDKADVGVRNQNDQIKKILRWKLPPLPFWPEIIATDLVFS